jgi:hypothetical protein
MPQILGPVHSSAPYQWQSTVCVDWLWGHQGANTNASTGDIFASFQIISGLEIQAAGQTYA